MHAIIKSAELFLFAGIMGIAAIVFTLLAIPYKYVEPEVLKKPNADQVAEVGENEKNNSISVRNSITPSTADGYAGFVNDTW